MSEAPQQPQDVFSDAFVQTLIAQRNEAQNAVAQLNGQVAVLRSQLQMVTKQLEEAKAPAPAPEPEKAS